jgi:hypothetical protein
MAKCAAITASGGACKGTPLSGGAYCYVHDPATKAERKRSGSKGGKLGGRGRPQLEIAGVKKQLQGIADGVLDGSVDRADASVVAQILGVLIKAMNTELAIKEQLEVLGRLEELEDELQRRGGRRYGS